MAAVAYAWDLLISIMRRITQSICTLAIMLTNRELDGLHVFLGLGLLGAVTLSSRGSLHGKEEEDVKGDLNSNTRIHPPQANANSDLNLTLSLPPMSTQGVHGNMGAI